MNMLSPIRFAGVGQRLAVFSDDEAVIALVGRLADEGVLANPRLAGGGPGAALGEAPRADVLVVDLDGVEDAETDIAQTAERWGRPVIALGGANDVAAYRRLTGAGARDYLVKPLGDADLMDALTRAAAPAGNGQGADAAAAPRGAAMIGVRGGVGATGLAVSVAWAAAEWLDCQTALVDLDLYFGSCALALDLLPGRGLGEALQSPERIDPLFVGSAMINASDRLFVLGGEDPLDRDAFVGEEALDALIEAVRQSVHCTVIDMPRGLALNAPGVLAGLDQIYLVTDFSVAGLRDVLRFKAWVADRLDAKTLSVVALEGPGKPMLSRKEFEHGLDEPVAAIVPHAAKQACEAATTGKAIAHLTGPRAPYGKAVEALARDVTGRAHAKRKSRPWRW